MKILRLKSRNNFAFTSKTSGMLPTLNHETEYSGSMAVVKVVATYRPEDFNGVQMYGGVPMNTDLEKYLTEHAENAIIFFAESEIDHDFTFDYEVLDMLEDVIGDYFSKIDLSPKPAEGLVECDRCNESWEAYLIRAGRCPECRGGSGNHASKKQHSEPTPSIHGTGRR